MQTKFFLFFLLIGCTDSSQKDTPEDSDHQTSDTSEPSDTNDSADATDSSDTADSSDTGQQSDDLNTTVCERWNEARSDLSEGTWSGNSSQCEAGDISTQGRENALQLVNFYRWLSNLSAVSTNPTKDAAAQACALIMHANSTLTHYPESTMACYTQAGSDAAGSSNLAPTPGVYAVDLYMADMGNETTLGHRRWILSNWLGDIGLGSTDAYSCMHVIGGNGNGTQEWTAFPPPGPVPFEMFSASWQTLDQTGWSVQSDVINLTNATVVVTRDDGVQLPMAVRSLAQYYGSSHAISMIPENWSTEAGREYTVTISGISTPIEYTVSPVTCQ